MQTEAAISSRDATWRPTRIVATLEVNYVTAAMLRQTIAV
eukprot:SAG11_NODE_4949_length_1712_cov_0.789213_1_plen_39_part_10